MKAELTEEGILETKRVKSSSSGLSAVQVREKVALGSMLYLLVSPSITLSEEWREATGGAVRSVVNTREPAVKGRTEKGQVPGEGSSGFLSCTSYYTHIRPVRTCLRYTIL